MMDITIRTEEYMMKKQTGVELLKAALVEETQANNGQVEEPAEDGKRCPVCCRIRPLDAFYKEGRSSDGLSYYCKSCKRALMREAYARKKKEQARKVVVTPQEPDLCAISPTDSISSAAGPIAAASDRILVDFRNYPELLEVLIRDAREEVRGVGGQIIYACKSYLQARQ